MIIKGYKLLSENRALRKIVLYALGEVMLIVVGILLALQVNNWNEARKQSKIRKIYIKDMLNELKTHREHFNLILKYSKERMVSYDRYFEATNLAQVSQQMLDSLAHMAREDIGIFNVEFFTYQELIASGNLAIFPVQLRRKLSSYHDLISNEKDRISKVLAESVEFRNVWYQQIDLAYHKGKKTFNDIQPAVSKGGAVLSRSNFYMYRYQAIKETILPKTELLDKKVDELLQLLEEAS